MEPKYKITIKKVETETGVEKRWVRLLDSDAPQMKAIPAPDQYGYAELPFSRETETIVLEQTTEELNLTAVIKAVNRIE